ncbi:MAG: phasin family protein [Candidatus Firestonebacteria bacterium]
MANVLEKILLAGLGAFALSEERTKELIEELVKRGEVTAKDGEGIIKEFLKKAKQSRIEIEDKVKAEIKKALPKMNIATQDDIKRLEKKINDLVKKNKKG